LVFFKCEQISKKINIVIKIERKYFKGKKIEKMKESCLL
jgi:hypothetical protein